MEAAGAAEALASMDAAGASRMMAPLMKDTDVRVRRGALEVMVRCAGKTDEVLTDLLPFLRDEDESVRLSMYRALNQNEHFWGHRELVGAALDGMRDVDSNVRIEAMFLAADVGRGNAEDWAVVKKAMEEMKGDRDAYVRDRAAYILGMRVR